MVPKFLRVAVLVSVTAIVATLGLAVSTPRPAAAASPVRIMPLGDSITAGTGCWRAYLWNQLQTSGYQNIDFVGGVSDGGGCNPGFSYDHDHEGHGGFAATGIASNNQLPPWLAAANPDIVLVHLGTNDMWGGYIPLADKLAAFTKLVGQMRADNPVVKIIVAQIIPMSASACSTCPADVLAFDNALPAWAAGLTTAQSPITLVDQWTGFDATADTVDGVHPNDTGYRKMAARWYPALAKVLGGTPPTTTTTPPVTIPPVTIPPVTIPPVTTAPVTTTKPPVTTTPVTTVTTKPPVTTTPPVATTPVVTTTRATTAPASPTSTAGSGGCTATYRIANEWPGGFQGEVSVRNDGPATTKGWSGKITFIGGQTVTQAWNATTSQSGSVVTFSNVSWNAGLAAGASTTFGFQGSWTGTNPVAAVSCTTS